MRRYLTPRQMVKCVFGLREHSEHGPHTLASEWTEIGLTIMDMDAPEALPSGSMTRNVFNIDGKMIYDPVIHHCFRGD